MTRSRSFRPVGAVIPHLLVDPEDHFAGFDVAPQHHAVLEGLEQDRPAGDLGMPVGTRVVLPGVSVRVGNSRAWTGSERRSAGGSCTSSPLSGTAYLFPGRDITRNAPELISASREKRSLESPSGPPATLADLRTVERETAPKVGGRGPGPVMAAGRATSTCFFIARRNASSKRRPLLRSCCRNPRRPCGSTARAAHGPPSSRCR